MSARKLLVASALAAVLACRVGIDDREPVHDGGATQCGALVFATPACEQCAHGDCCAEQSACAGDARCIELEACLARCAGGDDACVAACRTSHPDGFDAAAARLTTCLSTRCTIDCGLSCGGYPFPDAGCAACARASCCEAERACMGDLECATLVACERACNPLDDQCLGTCTRQHLGARPAADAFGACIESACPKACTPARWRCLGRTPPPLPPGTTSGIDVTIDVTSITDGKPIAGVTVRGCGQSDQDCTTPLSGPVVTDATGRVSLHFAANLFAGYFELVGADLMPALLFRPAVHSDAHQSFAALSKAAFTLLTSSITTARDDRGHVLFEVHDCADVSAAGVGVTIDPADDSVRAYVIGGSVSPGATATGPNGLAAFGNVRPYTGITVHATVVDLGLNLPLGSVFVRPGYLSYQQLRALR